MKIFLGGKEIDCTYIHLEAELSFTDFLGFNELISLEHPESEFTYRIPDEESGLVNFQLKCVKHGDECVKEKFI